MNQRTDSRTKVMPVQGRTLDKKILCKSCGYSHLVRKCPALGKTCNFCRKQNYFCSQCFKKKKQLQEGKVFNVGSSEYTEFPKQEK